MKKCDLPKMGKKMAKSGEKLPKKGKKLAGPQKELENREAFWKTKGLKLS